MLPISNPANLVLYGGHTPPLLAWLRSFAAASALSILATCLALFWLERRCLGGRVRQDVAHENLTPGIRTTLIGIGAMAGLLVVISLLDRPLGLPTCLAGIATAAIVLLRRREAPWALLRGIAWSVLPLVAGLFVLVAGLARSGVVGWLTDLLQAASRASPDGAAWMAGGGIALLGNLLNNLPAGLIASQALAAMHGPQPATDALLIGVDLGPNLSVTGSLATILWLNALRREGEDVGFMGFLARGAVVMPPALILALGARLLTG